MIRKRTIHCSTIAIVIALMLSPGQSYAEALSSTSLTVAAGLGLAGESTQSADVSGQQIRSVVRDFDNSLPPSLEFDAQYLFRLRPEWALGAKLGFHSLQSTDRHVDEPSRNFGFDLAFVPQFRVPLTDSFELYLSAPTGILIEFWNDARTPIFVFDGSTVESSQRVGLAYAHAKPTPGFHFSFRLGARFRLTPSVGVFAELGYLWRAFDPTFIYEPPSASGLRIQRVNCSITDEHYGTWLGVYF